MVSTFSTLVCDTRSSNLRAVTRGEGVGGGVSKSCRVAVSPHDEDEPASPARARVPP